MKIITSVLFSALIGLGLASGLCYGLNGSMEKVATGVYLLKPVARSNSYDESGYGA